MDRILLDIVYILSKFMNFQVAEIYGNNATLYRDNKNIETTVTKHFHN